MRTGVPSRRGPEIRGKPRSTARLSVPRCASPPIPVYRLQGDKLLEASSNRYSRFAISLTTVALAFFFLSFGFHSLNGILVDSYFRTLGAKRPYPGIALLAFDSGPAWGGDVFLPAEALALLISRISAQKPRAIGLLADLNEQHYSAADLQRVVSAIDPAVPLFVGYLDEMGLDRPAPTVFGDRLTYSPGLVSRDSFNYGADSVSRRVMAQIDHVPTFYARLATFVRGSTPDRLESLSSSRHAFIRWQGGPGTYVTHSAWSLLSPAPPDLNLGGKIVLVGQVRRTRPTQDAILTPYSRRLGDTTVLEGAAHGLVTLIRDDGLRRLPGWAVALLTLAVGLLTVNLVSSLSPVRGVLFMFAFLFALWATGWAMLRWGDWWLDLAHPAVMAVAGYYLVVPFRLGMEYRKRWHFQQRSEMMAQLETLKSNFLSLVSHDLKTPIARIQGNAELLLESPQLEAKQRKGLTTIVATTEQMSDYVETVLDLNRVESGQLQIRLESRDINVTLQEVLDEKRVLAQEKGIELRSELEPLFTVRYDVRLMRRVIGNLIENAIKYSPENSTITVVSLESDGQVRVEVRDQGIGIPEAEQARVFEKFYRAEGVTQTGIKGTGLGLYLVKYFVELHKGGVSLKSELGKGSTFSVSLPL